MYPNIINQILLSFLFLTLAVGPWGREGNVTEKAGRGKGEMVLQDLTLLKRRE